MAALFRAHVLTAVALLIVAGCSGTLGDSDGGSSTSDGGSGNEGSGADGSGASGASSGGGSTPSAGGSTSSGGAPSGPGGSGGAGATEQTCPRWQADRADLAEGNWSGSLSSCDAGDISAEGRANALKSINLYRWLAKLPAVTTDGARDQKTQECALMMHANNALSHTPPSSWQCFSGDGSEAAGSSNISPTPGVEGVDLYMADPGNETTMGHRRWILSGSLGPIGLGSTSGYSCMWVVGGSGSSALPFVAWPPPGQFPSGAVTASWASLNDTGWTIQSSSIDLSGASVQITDGSESLGVAVSQLAQGYGDTWAIRIVPQGWTMQAGHSYAVTVTGASQPIAYTVDVIDCP
jgi:uncharacterized protein YkwD